MDRPPVKISVKKSSYDDIAEFTGQRKIAEYSVTAEREVLHDRSYARYLKKDRIKDKVNYDLAAGYGSFINEDLTGKPTLETLSKWAIGQPGVTLEEVFGGAEFVGWRGTMARIANTLNYEPPCIGWEAPDKVQNLLDESNTFWKWSFVAQKFGEVIILCENKNYDGKTDLATYSGFKFEQYMTAATPEGDPDTSADVNNEPSFEMMVRSDLVFCGHTLKLCCGAEIDALLDDEPIELKTVWNGPKKISAMDYVLQCEMMGVKQFVIGYKEGCITDNTGNVSVFQVVKKTLEELRYGKFNNKCYKNDIDRCYYFLFDILSEIKRSLQSNEACKVSFDPEKKAVEIKSISKEEANFRGNGISDEFMARFNLQDE